MINLGETLEDKWLHQSENRAALEAMAASGALSEVELVAVREGISAESNSMQAIEAQHATLPPSTQPLYKQY